MINVYKATSEIRTPLYTGPFCSPKGVRSREVTTVVHARCFSDWLTHSHVHCKEVSNIQLLMIPEFMHVRVPDNLLKTQ